MSTLFDPIQIGDIALANRIVMAPLTRNRAIEGHVAGPLTVEYYRQRATAGLIIAEASQISAMAQGYLDTPGIYSDAQIAGWRQVTPPTSNFRWPTVTDFRWSRRMSKATRWCC